MTTRALTGGCLCGAVRYRAEGKAYHLTHCHCRTCRKASAAAFVSWFSVAASEFSLIQGEPVWFASSAEAERGFCGRCGTQLIFRRRGAQEVDLTICSLDAPERVSPEDHTWISRQLPWIELCDGLPAHPQDRPEPRGSHQDPQGGDVASLPGQGWQDANQVICPYCGEALTLGIDYSTAQQSYVEDCHICCRPILIEVRVDDLEHIEISARREND